MPAILSYWEQYTLHDIRRFGSCNIFDRKVQCSIWFRKKFIGKWIVASTGNFSFRKKRLGIHFIIEVEFKIYYLILEIKTSQWFIFHFTYISWAFSILSEIFYSEIWNVTVCKQKYVNHLRSDILSKCGKFVIRVQNIVYSPFRIRRFVY